MKIVKLTFMVDVQPARQTKCSQPPSAGKREKETLKRDSSQNGGFIFKKIIGVELIALV